MLNKRHAHYVKVALPKGRLLTTTSSLLNEIGLGFETYTRASRVYRLQSATMPHLSAKIFQEKDIPIQVAIGNYDLGICGLDWIEELLTKYSASALVKVTDLEYAKGNIYITASRYGDIPSLQDMSTRHNSWRIVSEYPNLAEASALNLRLRRFKIFPAWGAAEAYPPENADLVVLWAKDESQLRTQNLIPLKTLLPTSAFLIANRESWQTSKLSQIIDSFTHPPKLATKSLPQTKPKLNRNLTATKSCSSEEKVWLALPDGHQQTPTSKFLANTGFSLQGYSEEASSYCPIPNLDFVNVKVIRPQDMPLHIANGNFDLAITGRDWLLDHLHRFPSSPATEIMKLGFGEVRIVAVVSEDLPVNNIYDLKQVMKTGQLSPLRVASEYVNIADKYLRDNHVSPYKIIPTWGATEAFLPEDADMLIENTQTGGTLTKHKLKIIDTLFQSTACLIGNKNSLTSPAKKEGVAALIKILRQGVESN